MPTPCPSVPPASLHDRSSTVNMRVRWRLAGTLRRWLSAAAWRPAAHRARSSAVLATMPTGTPPFHMLPTRRRAVSASANWAQACSAVSYSAARSLGCHAAEGGGAELLAGAAAAAAAAASACRSSCSTSAYSPRARAACICSRASSAGARSAARQPYRRGSSWAAVAAAAAVGAPCCSRPLSAPHGGAASALRTMLQGQRSPAPRLHAASAGGCTPRRSSAAIGVLIAVTESRALGWRQRVELGVFQGCVALPWRRGTKAVAYN